NLLAVSSGKEINAPKRISPIIYLTLPITVETAERNSIGQDRLSNISVLNIEQCHTKDMAIEKIYMKFSNLF
ncbi:zinc finger MYM-type protein 1-like, partial [Aphis craccivora]